MLGSCLHPKPPCLTMPCHPGHIDTHLNSTVTGLLLEFKTSYPFEILNMSRKKDSHSFVGQQCRACWLLFRRQRELCGGGILQMQGSWGEIVRYKEEWDGEGDLATLDQLTAWWVGALSGILLSFFGVNKWLSLIKWAEALDLWWDQVHCLSYWVKLHLSSSPSGFVVVLIFQLLFVEETRITHIYLSINR